MVTSVRYLALLLLITLGACSQRTPSTESATPSTGTVTGRVVMVSRDSLERLRAQAPPPSAADLAFRRRFDSLAALVDTIVVVSPDSILLRIGETFPDERIREGAFRMTGEQLATYPGWRDIEDRSIATFSEAGVVGIRAGRTRVIFTVMGRRDSPRTYLAVRVVN